MEWWPHKPRIGPHYIAEGAYITCESGGYLPVSGGQLALVMAEVTTTNLCGQNTAVVHRTMYRLLGRGGGEGGYSMYVARCSEFNEG